MSKPRILLTGDDGFQSHGTRLLTHLLKDDCELMIAGTVTQQSGVGGKVSIASGFNWGKSEVDGVPTVWVEGTPLDAMEFMASFGFEKFDMVISGINWGANFGATLINSGTVCAALGSISRALTDRAIAISWDLPPEFYTMHHDTGHRLEEYFEYPGVVVKKLLLQCIKEKNWGAPFLNINLPKKPTTQVQVTRLTNDVRQAYGQQPKPDGDQGHYDFSSTGRVFSKTLDPLYDVRAVTEGFISITPCQVELIHEEVYQKLQDFQFKLQ